MPCPLITSLSLYTPRKNNNAIGRYHRKYSGYGYAKKHLLSEYRTNRYIVFQLFHFYGKLFVIDHSCIQCCNKYSYPTILIPMGINRRLPPIRATDQSVLWNSSGQFSDRCNVGAFVSSRHIIAYDRFTNMSFFSGNNNHPIAARVP